MTLFKRSTCEFHEVYKVENIASRLELKLPTPVLMRFSEYARDA